MIKVTGTDDDYTSPFGLLKDALKDTGVTAIFLPEETKIVLRYDYSHKDPDDSFTTMWFSLTELEKWWRRGEIIYNARKCVRELKNEAAKGHTPSSGRAASSD